MTEDIYTRGPEDKDRLMGGDAIEGELRQFKRLQHLSDSDVAFRMATDVAEVKRLRSMFGNQSARLREVKIDYQVRVILGANRIRTVAGLLAKTDKQLLALAGIGPTRLRHIRDCLKGFLA